MSKKIGIVQQRFSFGKEEANISIMLSELEKLKNQNSDLCMVIMPEMAVHGYSLKSNYVNLSTHKKGNHFDIFSEAAKQHNLYLVYGFAEKVEHDHRVLNAVNIISPRGKLLNTYRKIQLTSLETEIFLPGTELSILTTEIGTLSPLICWDLAFPELCAELAKERPSLIVAPSAWEDPYSTAFHRFSMSRAHDHTMYVVTANHVGEVDNLHFFGESACYAPDGNLIMQAPRNIPYSQTIDIDDQYISYLESDFYSMHKERRPKQDLIKITEQDVFHE